MPHGEMQLIAYGSQDIYLTGNPSITFFKFVYKKHTNFASEYIRQDFISLPTFNTNTKTKLKCKIERNGDLIHDVYLVYDLPNIYSTPKIQINNNNLNISQLFLDNINNTGEYFRWVNNLGENIINKAEIFIDGQIIDEQYGVWLNVWNELTLHKSKKESYDNMIGNISSLNNPSVYYGNYSKDTIPSIPSRRLYIPLPFWFCKNPGLAIPLIALQYNEIFIHIEFNELNSLFTVGNPPISPEKIFDEDYIKNFGNNSFSNSLSANDNNYKLREQLINEGYSKYDLFWRYINGTTQNSTIWNQNCYLDVNYIFLDEDERKKYAQINHEYLITQVQTSHFIINNLNQNIKESVNTLNLLFQHPVKELIWVLRRNDVDCRNQWNNYTSSIYDYNYNDNKNTFMNNFRNPNILTNSFHLNKIFIQNNYLKGLSNGFDNTGVRDNTCYDSFLDGNDYYNKNLDSFNQFNNIMYNAKLMFNGNDRFSAKDNTFFNYLQPFKYHTSTPSPGVNVFSFALNPEEDQPSGTCNMSRIDSVQLQLAIRWITKKLEDKCSSIDYNEGYELFIFARNYNVLRIMGGMGGLVFSN